MVSYNVVAEMPESTIVAEYTPELRLMEDSDYQSESALENKFIRQLKSLGYEYLAIHDEKALIDNLRTQLEKLNKYTFTDNEWKTFFDTSIANSNEGIVEKTKRFQTDHIQVLRQDDGSSRNILLIDKKQIHNNKLQVINQYEENTGNYKNRYDVTILVNGFPCVHVELKRRGVAIREAFNQINRYQRDSFWASSGLFEYVQIFVISNGTHTKYYSNTTRESHIKEFTASGKRQSKKTSNSFEFTSYWADGKNKIHTYTIVDAIGDGNVLPFKIDYVNTLKSKKDLENDESQVYSIDKENALMAPDRISKIVEYILKGFDTKTVRSRFYSHNGKRLNGFNSIFAVASIPFAKMYYLEFKKQLEATKRNLTVATIFSFNPNENQEDSGILSDEEMNTDDLDKSSRDFLEMAISDYNKKFNTNFDTSSEKFENYYKDLSQRV